ncbi:UvrABC system protein A [bacterium HR34]|nr:UvrABC system protein A [bacterium HR34]
MDVIKIRGARTHNLKNINLDIPKNKLVVVVGLSGSGKSSLAFDTLYAEGQRRYIESLSSYARQFLGVMQKPDVEKIEGITPSIAIDQRKSSHNPRSIVGTATEVYDYLRLLFARVGKAFCPVCNRELTSQTIDNIVDKITKLKKDKEILILGPAVKGKKGFHKDILEEIKRQGFLRVRINKKIYTLKEALDLEINKNKRTDIEVVVDRIILEDEIDLMRIRDSVETALKIGKGFMLVLQDNKEYIFSEVCACQEHNISFPNIEPRLFSFNSPYGACQECHGLGEKLEIDPELVVPDKNLSIEEGAIVPWYRASHKIGRQGYFWWVLSNLSEKYNFSLSTPFKNLPRNIQDIILYGDGEFEGVIPSLERRYYETDSEATKEEISQYMIEKKCKRCEGKRLRMEALYVKVAGKNIYEVCSLSIDKCEEFFKKIKSGYFTKEQQKIAGPILKEVLNRISFMKDVGLGYLSLNRKIGTLSGGEEQRIRLATQIGIKLTGVLYVLDEPSIGLHPRDQKKLVDALKNLRDLGNTVLVVEHDPLTIKEADFIIEIGPEAGEKGGGVVFAGPIKEFLKKDTITTRYLKRKEKVFVPKPEKPNLEKFLIIKGAKENNLKNITVKFPLKNFICVTGVSGSGKSTLVNDILVKALMKYFYNSKEMPGKHDEILGIENIERIIVVDQSPIGRTPRSNPATYTGVFTLIREVFANTREAKIRGYKPGRFSFNVKGGRCEACEGQGEKKIEMYFLPDVYVKCSECDGTRYNKATLEIEYNGKNIAQVLDMSVSQAIKFFDNIYPIKEKLKVLEDVGLGYIKLGQSATSLSGGEAQRVKLATELSKKGEGNVLYVLDEPTTGLHTHDVKKLVFVLRRLVEKGNTVIAIEHNLDFIRNADWIIDLGPEGGEKGGEIIFEGTPKDILKCKKSWTGKFLKEF